mmetsp:Transcript_19857/g.76086  ORF Transcript_19857/g.76086 Transcript_19857/m.76086 type:complete len:275 (+) Transcript_19857:57-881(+)
MMIGRARCSALALLAVVVLALIAAASAGGKGAKRRIVPLTEDSFEKETSTGNWLLLYHDGKGKRQQTAMRELLAMQEEQRAAFPLLLGIVDCREDEDLCLDAGFKTSARPAFALLREQIKGFVAKVGDASTGEGLMKEVERVLLGDVVDLDRSHFPHLHLGPVTGSSDDLPWIVMFKNNFCMHCRMFLPEWVKWAKTVRNKLHVAVVDCGKAPRVCAAHGIEVTPTVVLFPSEGAEGIVYDKSRQWNVFFENYGPDALQAFVAESTASHKHDEL